MNGLVLIVAALALAYFWQRGSVAKFLAWFDKAAKPKTTAPPGAGRGLAGGGGGSW